MQQCRIQYAVLTVNSTDELYLQSDILIIFLIIISITTILKLYKLKSGLYPKNKSQPVQV